jgi:hypothetical protein
MTGRGGTSLIGTVWCGNGFSLIDGPGTGFVPDPFVKTPVLRSRDLKSDTLEKNHKQSGPHPALTFAFQMSLNTTLIIPVDNHSQIPGFVPRFCEL